MPLLQPRGGDNDGGYAVQDYRAVRTDLGTVDDLRDLATTLRGRGISLVMDLVLNHVAREHAWAVGARAGDASYRDYFHVFPDRTEPDAYERSLPEVFPDFAPGNFTYDDDLDAWVWTTFNEWQWDLNWANPAVLCEFAEIILWLANLGVEVLRLDAIAFLWKRLGTSCQNQPEVHAITQALHAVTRIAAPAVAFKAEAIVGPRDLVQYLGSGPHAGRVSDLAYHNSLMVQTWSMLAARNVVLARQALSSLPPTPSTGTWITYVRCHDDIGWAIDDGDAWAAGVTGEGHRRFLSDWYSGEFPGSWADGLVFQPNLATGDRRISGTTASLAGFRPGANPPEVDAALSRIFLAHAVAAGWGGVPVVWSGDELAQPNDPSWADEPGHEDDNRWAHRPRLDWMRAKARGDLRTIPARPSADWPISPASAPRSPSSTRRRPRTSYPTPTTGSWPPSAATPAASSWASTTSPRRSAASASISCTRSASPARTRRWPAIASRSAPTACSSSPPTPRGGWSRRRPELASRRDPRLTGDAVTCQGLQRLTSDRSAPAL